jgi:hypothetical protein
MNETSSFLILAFVTIVMSTWTLVSLRWWTKNNLRFYKLCKGWLALLALPLWIGSIVVVIVAPMFLLMYLMGEMKLEKDFYPYGAGAVLLLGLFLV